MVTRKYRFDLWTMCLDLHKIAFPINDNMHERGAHHHIFGHATG